MGRYSRPLPRTRLGWADDMSPCQVKTVRLQGLALKTLCALSFGLLIAVAGVEIAKADSNTPSRSDGQQPATGAAPTENNGSDAAEGSQSNGSSEPRGQRRFSPRRPQGPGCPYRERKLELIV